MTVENKINNLDKIYEGLHSFFNPIFYNYSFNKEKMKFVLF